MMHELETTINLLSARGKGILAADESTKTITKRFEALGIPCTEENRRAYRSLLCTTPDLNQFISGVIFYEETLYQKSDEGTPIPNVLNKQNILIGIKVDQGLINLANTHEKVTQGLDGLAERLQNYKKIGARFAKWRAVYNIHEHLPSILAMQTNAELLARYAAICQANGFVPIVEPELLMDGNHDIEACAKVTENVLHEVFDALYRHHVSLEHMVLKPNMVIAGEDHPHINAPEDVAKATLKVLLRTVPAAVPTINFLSGGQSCEQATANLQAINSIDSKRPWHLSYSYGRALQQHCVNAWKGNPENLNAAQAQLFKRAKLNTAATLGQYRAGLETKI